MKRKQIDTPELRLVLKHHKLIEEKRKRGFSAKAIVKVILSAENSER